MAGNRTGVLKVISPEYYIVARQGGKYNTGIVASTFKTYQKDSCDIKHRTLGGNLASVMYYSAHNCMPQNERATNYSSGNALELRYCR